MTTIEDVRNFKTATADYLCPPAANVFGIDFTAFAIRDMDRNIVLFESKKDSKDDEVALEDKSRSIQYHFGPNFFQLRTIGTTIEFRVGDKPVKDFVMIERHYFGDRLLQNYEFRFPFCMPKTTNTIEQIYDLPVLDAATQQAMIDAPFATKSDTFYFVEGKLVMHNKAEYSYAPF